MKGGVVIIHEKVLAESKKIDEQILAIEAQCTKLPPGKLVCSHNQNRYKWYQSDGHTKTYIPKANRKLAEQLAIKKYLSLSLEDLKKEKRAIQFYLNHHNGSRKAEHLITEPSEFKNLLSPYFSPLSKELAIWSKAEYEQNRNYPEQLVHEAPSGIAVRSKSEVMIDMYLYMNNVPFHYEEALQLGETTLFPDFTIRHPKTGVTYYWEHFGMMDNPQYSKNAYSKMQLYTSYGIIPSIQLITTYETKEYPLSAGMVRKIVEHYFL